VHEQLFGQDDLPGVEKTPWSNDHPRLAQRFSHNLQKRRPIINVLADASIGSTHPILCVVVGRESQKGCGIIPESVGHAPYEVISRTLALPFVTVVTSS
jgi:hypothetical protein